MMPHAARTGRGARVPVSRAGWITAAPIIALAVAAAVSGWLSHRSEPTPIDLSDLPRPPFTGPAHADGRDLTALAAPLTPQMSARDVVAALGSPASIQNLRHSQIWLYSNDDGTLRVVLHNGAVSVWDSHIAAVRYKSPQRRTIDELRRRLSSAMGFYAVLRSIGEPDDRFGVLRPVPSSSSHSPSSSTNSPDMALALVYPCRDGDLILMTHGTAAGFDIRALPSSRGQRSGLFRSTPSVSTKPARKRVD